MVSVNQNFSNKIVLALQITSESSHQPTIPMDIRRIGHNVITRVRISVAFLPLVPLLQQNCKFIGPTECIFLLVAIVYSESEAPRFWGSLPLVLVDGHSTFFYFLPGTSMDFYPLVADQAKRHAETFEQLRLLFSRLHSESQLPEIQNLVHPMFKQKF